MMMKNYFFLALFLLIYSLGFSQQMPIDFSDQTDTFSTFGSTSFSTRNDPKDNSNIVGEFHNNGTNANQGFYIDLSTSIDIGVQKEITLSFYSFDPNPHSIVLKLESGTNSDVEITQTFSVPSPSDWKTITFDFSAASGTYSRVTIFIDKGTTTTGTYLIDNITDGSTPTDPNELDVVYTKLVWADEFNTDGAIDATKWFHQTKIPKVTGWHNEEVQHYTNRIENSNVSNGFLYITAIKEDFTDQGVTKQYTSARLNSKFAFTYGRLDVKAKLPAENGTWPAIWSLGKNINEDGGYWDNEFGTTSWPACGEIDTMEHGLHANNEVSSAIHTPSSSGSTMNTESKMLNDVTNEFHIYSMNWSPNQITFLIDNVAYYTYKPATKDDSTWPFDKDQYLLLNLAMGGYAGPVDPNFTQSSMIIDYVRVYQSAPLSTSTVFADKFSVYPNPASNFIKINTSEKIQKLELYSTLGQLVLKSGNSKQLNTEQLPSGLYLLKIYSDNNKTATKKIVIK